MTDVMATAKRITANVEKAIVGKRRQVILSLVSWFCEGHVLLEDVPGVAKTVLARALAASVGCRFSRVQCTPDLLPSDVTGASVFNQKTTEFEFRPGPIFAQVVLADEINRTTPRTQSALLEAMSEGQVSCDGQTYPLPRPFMVIATQNPLEFEGTYPLPESQLDRFLMRISVGYPDRADETEVLRTHREGEPVDSLPAVLTCEQVVALQDAVRRVKVDDSINSYLLDVVAATRSSEDLRVGVSTRGALALYRASQAAALVDGREYVVPDDVKSLAVPVLAHRVITKGYLHGGQRAAVEALLARLVEDVAVPE